MYKSGEVIDNNDIGKILTNGNAEIANYNFFAITVKTTLNSSDRFFTFLFIRTSDNSFKNFSSLAVSSYTSTSTSSVKSYRFQITISGNTFSITGVQDNSSVSCSIYQIRGLF